MRCTVHLPYIPPKLHLHVPWLPTFLTMMPRLLISPSQTQDPQLNHLLPTPPAVQLPPPPPHCPQYHSYPLHQPQCHQHPGPCTQKPRLHAFSNRNQLDRQPSLTSARASTELSSSRNKTITAHKPKFSIKNDPIVITVRIDYPAPSRILYLNCGQISNHLGTGLLLHPSSW